MAEDLQLLGELAELEREFLRSARREDTSPGPNIRSATDVWVAKGADPTLRDDVGWTAMHWAVQGARLRCLSALLEAGAPLEVRDHRGRTPLMLAVIGSRASKHVAVVDLLLRHGADVNAHDDMGWSVLHMLALVTHERDVRREITSLLLHYGARAYRDHDGQSPADLRKHQVTRFAAHGPFDPNTPVAPGPTAPRLEIEPKLVARLLDELIPVPTDPAAPNPSWPRGSRDSWTVLADWLQGQGDPRGELVAASLACTQVGSRRRVPLREHQRRAAAKAHSLTHLALYRADPPAAIGSLTSIQIRLTHGLVTSATIGPSIRGNRARSGARQMVDAASAFLRFEPLLAELRLRRTMADWPKLIELLAGLPPAPRVRRLVLENLPAKLPSFEPLVPMFPALRSLWLLGAYNLESGVVRWPGPLHLRIRHGLFGRSQGLVNLKLELANLTHLDLELPPGRVHATTELRGAVKILDRIGELPHLRLSGLTPEFAAALLPCDGLARLRTLELVGVQGSILEELIRHAGRLRGLARVCVIPKPGEYGEELERLRAVLPQLVIEHRARLRRRDRPSVWA
jgi:hypothetical protein